MNKQSTSTSSTTNKEKIPKRVFIVPYRNRLQQKFFFSNQMSFLLDGKDDYEIYFSHQCDQRQFNRGATKNIGFLAVKEAYPEHYRDITFIFNDVDTLPFHRIFDYQTTHGVVKHYYGFDYALGGIVVMKGADFERINGYPNFWGWGNEDSVLQTRCMKKGLVIDRSQFYGIGSPEILQLFDGVSRLVSPREHAVGVADSGVNGLTSLHRITYSVDAESLNKEDNVYGVDNPRIRVINVLTFMTETGFDAADFYKYDLRDSTRTIVQPDYTAKTGQRVVTTEDWKNIPAKAVPNRNKSGVLIQPSQQIRQPQRSQSIGQSRQQQQSHSLSQSQSLGQSRQQQQSLSASQLYSAGYAAQIGVKPRASISQPITRMSRIGSSRLNR